MADIVLEADEGEYTPQRKSVIGFGREDTEEFLYITLCTRHGFLRRSNAGTRVTPSWRVIYFHCNGEEGQYQLMPWTGTSCFFTTVFLKYH